MSSMIERVARALERDSLAPGPMSTEEMFRRQARAAIEAMREPTEEMVKAGTGNITLQSIYRAMILAASEGGPKP